jgi:hypothetical protein
MPPQNQTQYPNQSGVPPQQQNGGQDFQAQFLANEMAHKPAKKRRWAIPVVLFLVVTLLAVGGFAMWAYAELQGYQNNFDEKVTARVAVLEEEISTAKDNELLEREKQPYRNYRGAPERGSVEISYPKTWSAHIIEDRGLEGYLHPDYVPGLRSGVQFAFRMQVLDRTYDQELKSLDSKTRSGAVRVNPYRAPNVENVLGVIVTGEVNTGQDNIMVLFPIRDKTLKIWTESPSFHSDFNNIILANLRFDP